MPMSAWGPYDRAIQHDDQAIKLAPPTLLDGTVTTARRCKPVGKVREAAASRLKGDQVERDADIAAADGSIIQRSRGRRKDMAGRS
jgi:hypothetical protein